MNFSGINSRIHCRTMKVICIRMRGMKSILFFAVAILLVLAQLVAIKQWNVIALVKTKSSLMSLVPEKAELAPNSIEKFGLHKTFLLKEYHEPRTLYKFTLEPKNYTDIFGDTGLSEVSMVIVVKSENGNIERRQAIRATWGTYENQSDFKMFTVFIVGLTENKELQLNISEESKKYGDILQIDAEDDYDLVIHKTLAGMQWFVENFSGAWLFSSADDDIVVNTRRLFDQIKALKLTVQTEGVTPSTDLSRFPVFCGFRLSKNSFVIRNKANKWFISKSYYPIKHYPPYCLGPFYTMSHSMASLISDKSRYLIPFQIDDVWVSGILRLVIQINHFKYTEKELESGITSPKGNDIPVMHIPDHTKNGESLIQNMEKYWKDLEKK